MKTSGLEHGLLSGIQGFARLGPAAPVWEAPPPNLCRAGFVGLNMRNANKLALAAALFAVGALSLASEPKFPYGSPAFRAFVADSFNIHGGNPDSFFAYMDKQSKEKFHAGVGAILAKEGRLIAGAGKSGRVKAETEAARRIHNLVKKTIPKFSLDRGFEFHYTVLNGERQCFLQSVIVAGMLQKLGLNAGVAMVNANEKGESSFNGHAVAILHLSDGTDRIVDCSEPYPFATHKGLFLRDSRGAYAYVQPGYSQGDALILSYKDLRSGKNVPPAKMQGIDVNFIRSMFDYYRGERAVGGLLAPKATPQGLQESLKYLTKSTQDSNDNPLAWAMLGRTYERLGQKVQAMPCYRKAYDLGKAAGWIAPTVLQKVRG